MLRNYTNLIYSASIGAAFLLRIIHIPDQFVWLVVICLVAGALISNFTRIRTTGLVIGFGGLLFVYRFAPGPSPSLIVMLTFLAISLFTATGLLIAADLSTPKEPMKNEG